MPTSRRTSTSTRAAWSGLVAEKRHGTARHRRRHYAPGLGVERATADRIGGIAERPAQYLRPSARSPSPSLSLSHPPRNVRPTARCHTPRAHTHAGNTYVHARRIRPRGIRRRVDARGAAHAGRGRAIGCYLARASATGNSTFSHGEPRRFSRRETLIFQRRRPSSRLTARSARRDTSISGHVTRTIAPSSPRRAGAGEGLKVDF